MAAIAVVASGTWAWATYGPRSAREQLAARVDGDKPADANYDCLLQPDTWTGTLPLEECRFGAAGEVDLVLWGDSHAMALAPIVLAMQHSGTSAFLQLTMGNCLPFEQQTTGSAALNSRCSRFNRQVLSELAILKARGLKGVVLAGKWNKLWNAPLSAYVRPPRPLGVHDLFTGRSPASAACTLLRATCWLRACVPRSTPCKRPGGRCSSCWTRRNCHSHCRTVSTSSIRTYPAAASAPRNTTLRPRRLPPSLRVWPPHIPPCGSMIPGRTCVPHTVVPPSSMTNRSCGTDIIWRPRQLAASRRCLRMTFAGCRDRQVRRRD